MQDDTTINKYSFGLESQNQLKFNEPFSGGLIKQDNSMLKSGQSSQTAMSFMDIHQYENHNQFQFKDKFSFATQVQPIKAPIDDRIFIHMDGKPHQVDTIVDQKKTPGGQSLFCLAMCCHCCKSRNYWFSKKKIMEYGCAQL